MNGLLAYILAKRASKNYTDEKISQLPVPYKVKEAVNTFSDLPTTGNEPGDVRETKDTGNEYYWDGTAWEKFGGKEFPTPNYPSNGGI
mgnify:CR=1 FL=1